MRAIWIPSDGPCTEVDIDGTDFRAIGHYVRGAGQEGPGYIEAAAFLPGAPIGDCGTMYVNEEGLILGLAPNPRASYMTRQRLVGDALLLGPNDSHGNETPVTAEAAQHLNRICGVHDAEGRLFADDWDGTAEHRAFHPTVGRVQ